jgi:hypothetical protein
MTKIPNRISRFTFGYLDIGHWKLFGIWYFKNGVEKPFVMG